MLDVAGRHPSVQAYADKFRYEHLPAGLPREVSSIFHDAAQRVVHFLPDAAEVATALRKLWEAKNEAVYHAVNIHKEREEIANPKC